MPAPYSKFVNLTKKVINKYNFKKDIKLALATLITS